MRTYSHVHPSAKNNICLIRIISEFSQTLDLKVGGSVELEGDHQVIIKSSLIIVSL